MVPVYGGVLIGVGCFLFTFAALAFAILIAVALKKGKGFSDWLKGKYSQAKGIEKGANKALSGVTQTPAQLPGNGPNNSTAKPVSQLGNPSNQPLARPPIPGLKDTDPCTVSDMATKRNKIQNEVVNKNATLNQFVKPNSVSSMSVAKKHLIESNSYDLIFSFSNITKEYIEDCARHGVNDESLGRCSPAVKDAVVRVLEDVIVPNFKKIYSSIQIKTVNNRASMVCNLTDDELKRYIMNSSKQNFLKEVHRIVGKDSDVSLEPWSSEICEFYAAVFVHAVQYYSFHNNTLPNAVQSRRFSDDMNEVRCNTFFESAATLYLYENKASKLQKEVADLQAEDSRMSGLQCKLHDYEKQQNSSQIS